MITLPWWFLAALLWLGGAFVIGRLGVYPNLQYGWFMFWAGLIFGGLVVPHC